MRFSPNEIRANLKSQWSDLSDTPYPEDFLFQEANSYLPTDYSDIIKDWTSMPSEFDNSWQEDYPMSNRTITELMSIDLLNYYMHTCTEIYNELKAEEEHN
jgi:hypothetical protein